MKINTENQSIHDRVKRMERNFKAKYASNFKKAIPSTDGSINIITLLDKRKDIEHNIESLINRRDNELMEQVGTMTEGMGFGELALKKEGKMG